jgi:hypothetical protein
MRKLAYKHTQTDEIGSLNQEIIEEDIRDTLRNNCSFGITKNFFHNFALPGFKIRNAIRFTIFFESFRSQFRNGDTFTVRVSAGGGPVNEEKFTYEEGMHYVSIPALDGYSGLYTGSRWTPYNALSIECNAAVISHIIVTGNNEAGNNTPADRAIDHLAAHGKISIPFLQKITHPRQENSRIRIAPGLLHNCMVYTGGMSTVKFSS